MTIVPKTAPKLRKFISRKILSDKKILKLSHSAIDNLTYLRRQCNLCYIVQGPTCERATPNGYPMVAQISNPFPFDLIFQLKRASNTSHTWWGHTWWSFRCSTNVCSGLLNVESPTHKRPFSWGRSMSILATAWSYAASPLRDVKPILQRPLRSHQGTPCKKFEKCKLLSLK